MKIEIWRCDNGGEEIHHFVEGESNTYIFGINAKLLGESFYKDILKQVERRIQCISHSPFSFAKK